MSAMKILATLCAIACISELCPTPARAADGVIGPANCNEAGFVGVLNTVIGSSGGTITFNCGAAPTTITFTAYRQIYPPFLFMG